MIVAGLDQDYRGRPFEPMPQLMAVAEYVDKTLAICMRCGAPANRSQRLVAAQDRVVVGRRRPVRGPVPQLLRTWLLTLQAAFVPGPGATLRFSPAWR